ncbi:hypothetical protein [Streptomyces sp. YIM 98790]|uniref:hypothetical protein n=1 Tax=Streptomyces sp. YIM 98790 TaxID=2689077 RepID=UPI00140799FF|nr:hypothetical protein [Streptomyces sp. YIM 98790]
MVTNRGDLAHQLRLLAREPELSEQKTALIALADDLDTGSDLDRWARLDLVGTLGSPDGLTEGPVPAATRRAGWLEGFLGVLVFVPLLVTWWGLRAAGQAYSELAAADPEQAARPFLQLWLNDFEGELSGFGRFDHIALTAVLLIMGIVLIALWHGTDRARSERAERERERRREQLAARLVAVLTRVQLAVTPQLAGSPQRFADELTKAAGELRAMIGKAAKGQQATESAVAAAERATKALREAAQRLSDAVVPLNASTDRLESAVRNGQDETARLSAANAAEVRGVGDRVGEAGLRIESALRDLTRAHHELRGVSEKAVESTDRASRAMATSSARTDDAVDSMREAAERWDVAAAHWEHAASRLETSLRELTGGGQVPAPVGPGSAAGANGTGR